MRIRSSALASAIAVSLFAFVSCGKRDASAVKPSERPRAALVLPSGTADAPSSPCFRGFYDEAERRGARLESGGAVYGFGESALLRAEAPLPGGADSEQLLGELSSWGAGLIVMPGSEFSLPAIHAARAAPGVLFVVIDADLPAEPGPGGVPSNLSFIPLKVREAAFMAGALSGGILSAGSAGSSPRAGFIGMAQDDEAERTGLMFEKGFSFALGEEDPDFSMTLVKDGKSWVDPLGRLMKPSTGAVLIGRGPFRQQALSLAGSRGILVALDGDEAVSSGPEPLARAVKRLDRAAAFILGSWLEKGSSFVPPPGLGLAQGCVEMKVGAGYEGMAAPHAGLLARAAQAASALKPETNEP